jgi:RNA polymerase sigma-70 factor (ECF subfamily)
VDPNPFTEVDRNLLKRCLNREAGSWNDFVDRFLSLIYHVIGYTAHLRSVRLTPEDVEDIAAEVLLKIVAADFRVLREFRGEASLATYLTVVARRICIQELVRRQAKDPHMRAVIGLPTREPEEAAAALKGMESLEEVDKLLRRLSGREREIVRLYYLEGRSYEEISTATEMPVNTIGAVLSRARKKLRAAVKSSKPGGVDSLNLAAGAPQPPSSPKINAPPPEPGTRPVKPPKAPKSAKMPKPGTEEPRPE